MDSSLQLLGTGPDPARVIAKATVRAAEALGLSSSRIHSITGISPSSFSRMKNHDAVVRDPKTQQLALLFLRVYRSLNAIVGGDAAKAAAWLRAENSHVRGVPLDLMQDPAGLVHVAEYLDAMRAKV